jgi:WD40 repeat protein
MPFAVSPAGKLIAFGTEDVVILCEIDAGKVAHNLEGHLDAVRAIAFSPNGELVASCSRDKTVRFWSVEQGKQVHAIKNVPADASQLLFSSDGRRIAIVHGRNADIRSAEF